MNIKTVENNNIIVVSLVGEVDLYNTKEINELFEQFIQDGNLQVILDLENVPFMDSSGFVGLITWTKKFQQFKGGLKILNISGFVAKIAKQNSMSELLHIYDSMEDAIQSFQL